MKSWKIHKTINDLFHTYKNDQLMLYNQKEWKEYERIDFIKYVCSGYPVPDYLAEVTIQKQKMVIEMLCGAEQMKAIIDYINNCFAVDGKYFEDLSYEQRKEFMTKSIGINILQQGIGQPANIKDIVKMWKKLK